MNWLDVAVVKPPLKEPLPLPPLSTENVTVPVGDPPLTVAVKEIKFGPPQEYAAVGEVVVLTGVAVGVSVGVGSGGV
ncbi:MAG: hypothetical protein ABI939_00350, partial [Anaerolineaceae bacterium]